MLMSTANSWNTRPTTPPMKNTGMNTATSESVIEMMVKPISREPLSAASIGRHAVLDVADDVLQHHDRVVDHEADRQGQRHQRDVVERIAAEIHGREGADDRHRQRQRRDDRGGRSPQEQEDDQHDEDDGEAERILHVVRPRRGSRRDAVVEHVDLDRAAAAAARNDRDQGLDAGRRPATVLASGWRETATVMARLPLYQLPFLLFSTPSMTRATSRSRTGAPLR